MVEHYLERSSVFLLPCRLQDLVNSALFKIVSPGNQEVVIDLANFLIGGKNIQNADRVEAIIVLNGDDAGLQFVRNGTKIPARGIEVEYDKEGSTDVQVSQVKIKCSYICQNNTLMLMNIRNQNLMC